MKILDTFSRKKILLKKSKKPLNLFVCGPTVYDYIHIGNARTYIVFDAFAKYLRSRGLGLFYLQNITDVDDKIINRAIKENISYSAVAKKFEREYFSDAEKLNITSVSKYAKATDYVKEIQNQIKTLIKKGYAYETKNGVYFQVSKFKNYGLLSKKNLPKLRPGYRVEPDPAKKDPLDFALWKKETGFKIPAAPSKKIISRIAGGKPVWSSPWGWGRPGWHIEDTAITEKHFGPQYDIHGGGIDIIFPHHESEVAQQEAKSGKKPLVKIWMHVGMLLVNGEKMSKSLGNFITAREFLKTNSADVLRMVILSNHYRSPLNFKKESVMQAEKSLAAIKEFAAKLDFVCKNGKPAKTGFNIEKLMEKREKEFCSAMDDDFNTPKALAAVFGFISELQNHIWLISPKNAEKALKFITEKLKIFEIKPKPSKIPGKIRDLAGKREQFRSNKQFIQSDKLRDKIKMLGYGMEDTPLGAFIVKK